GRPAADLDTDHRQGVLHPGGARGPAVPAVPRPVGHPAHPDRRLPGDRARAGGRPVRPARRAQAARDPRGVPVRRDGDLHHRAARRAARGRPGRDAGHRRARLRRGPARERDDPALRRPLRHLGAPHGAGRAPAVAPRGRRERAAGRDDRRLRDAHPAHHGPDDLLLPPARRPADRRVRARAGRSRPARALQRGRGRHLPLRRRLRGGSADHRDGVRAGDVLHAAAPRRAVPRPAVGADGLPRAHPARRRDARRVHRRRRDPAQRLPAGHDRLGHRRDRLPAGGEQRAPAAGLQAHGRPAPAGDRHRHPDRRVAARRARCPRRDPDRRRLPDPAARLLGASHGALLRAQHAGRPDRGAAAADRDPLAL
ncbi:MAG: hypothetical protein AVDCRST_MAG30-1959, partial [uncultured Solirubrobacteraceae bacterium]